MRPSLPLTTAIAAVLFLTSPTSASPVQPQPRAAAATVYSYMSATTIPASSTTSASSLSCPNTIISDKSDCPSGCTAAPVAGLVGAATNSWKCMSKPAETSWTSVMATSTCESGSAVTTYTLWGGQREMGCHATGS